MVDQLEFTMCLQQAGMGADAVDEDAREVLGGGDQGVRHGALRQIDDQIVDRVAGSALDDVERQDVGTDRAERNGE